MASSEELSAALPSLFITLSSAAIPYIAAAIFIVQDFLITLLILVIRHVWLLVKVALAAVCGVWLASAGF